MAGKKTADRAAVRVARKIVSEIRRRRQRPGTKLASEHRMVEELGVARATVREALRFLELQGALRIKAGPGGGPVVSVPSADHLASVLSLQLQFADESFRSVAEARRAIYPLLAAQAAEHATHKDIESLHRSVARMRSVVADSDLLTEELRRFQDIVAAASGNTVLGLLVNALHRMSEGSGVEHDSKQCRAAVRSSEEVLRAIEAGEAEAARVVTEKWLSAAIRYWERVHPDALKQPIAWIQSAGS
ncbi:MAG: GntR family transcriptional regulator [Deltaproteobacteria bacterium]|jgi:DNA-binding FadR family transcriptional regulator|nr:GntR family transcriptional regulator [Deltaproteobacteria bacterium]